MPEGREAGAEHLMEAPAPAGGEVDDPFSSAERISAPETATSLETKFSAVSLSQDLDGNRSARSPAPASPR